MPNFIFWFGIHSCYLIAGILLLFWIYVKRKLSILKDLKIPHDDPGFYGMGTLNRMKKNPRYMILEHNIANRKKYGDVFGKYMMLTPIVTVWDPEILKEIFIKKFDYFPDRQNTMTKITGFMNDRLTIVRGKKWKRIRSTLSPGFSTTKLKEMFPLVESISDELIDTFNDIIDLERGDFEAKKRMGRFAMDVVASASFSINFNSQRSEEEPKTIKLMKDVLTAPIFQRKAIKLLMFFPWVENFYQLINYSVLGKEFNDHMQTLMSILLNPENKVFRADFLQMMLKSEIRDEKARTSSKGLTRQEIISNGIMMIFAGYETTSHTLTYLLFNLATHPEIQDKLREEINKSVEAHGNTLTYEAVNEPKFLNMCINESLRMHPTALVNKRCCEKNINIKGIQFLKGMTIEVPIYGLSRDERYWDEPNTFKPDRMKDMSKVDSIIYQPFGAGPRNCIGKRFALMVVKYAICRLLINFKFEPTKDTPPLPLEMKVHNNHEIFLKVTRI